MRIGRYDDMQTNTLLALNGEELAELIRHHSHVLGETHDAAAADRHRKRIEQLEDAMTPAHLRVRVA